MQSSCGRTALFLASMGGHVDVVRHLISVGADSGLLDRTGMTALIAASSRGHAEVVAQLVHACDPDATDESERSALYYVVLHDHAEVLSLLIVRGGARWWEDGAVTRRLAQREGSWRCLEVMEVGGSGM